MKKLICLALALFMILSLAACGKGKNADSSADDKATVPQVDTSNSVGSLVLSGTETAVTIYYGEDGKVVAIGNTERTPLFTELNGEDCAAAVSKILKENDPPIVHNVLLVKQTAGSQTPSENFLETIMTEAKAALSDNVTAMLCPAGEQNDLGHISPELAKALLAAYMGNPEGATYASTTIPNDDGYYEANITINNYTDEYLVNAYNGNIELVINNSEPETEDVSIDFIEDEYIDTDITDYIEEEVFE